MNFASTLSIIGQLSSNELTLLTKEFKSIEFDAKTSEGFEPSLIALRDRENAERFGVRRSHLSAMLKRNDYARFNSRIFLPIAVSIFKSRFGKDFTPGLEFCFQGYYAATHDDRHFKTNYQIMFIIANGGHQIYSDGSKKLIVPTRGDIVVLNTHMIHALFPSPNTTALKCAKHPLKFCAMPIFVQETTS